MKTINYKQIKSIRNLPKFDLGTKPINSGYQRNDDRIQTGYYTQTTAPITNSFVPEAISNGASSLMSAGQLGYDAFKSLKSATNNQTFSNNMQRLINDKFNVSANPETLNTATNTTGNTASNVTSAASKGLAALSALHGTANLIGNQFDYKNTLTSRDLQDYSSKSTQYINGVEYDAYGGYDSAAADKYIKDQNTGSTIKGVTSGLEAGSGIGSLILPGWGTAIGAGIGALTGFIGSIFGGKSRKNKFEETKRNWTTTASNYNRQNESEAASEGLRNQYYATHADKGLSVDTKNPNALVQGGEPIVAVDKKGNIKYADMFPITQYTPERVDNIPVRLDQGSTRHGVIGNKIDPFTGERLAVEGRPLVEALNDPTIKNKKPYKEGLKYLLDLQDNISDDDMNTINAYGCGKSAKRSKSVKKYGCGKSIPKLDGGMSYSLIPTALNYTDNLAGLLAAKRDPINVQNTYTPNYSADRAINTMPTTVNIDPALDELNTQARQSAYVINSSNVAPGMRQVMLSQLYNDRMRNMTSLRYNKADKENELRAAKASMISQLGAQDQAVRAEANARYQDNLARANAQKRLSMDTRRKAMADSLNAGFENLFNYHMFNKNIDLYNKKLSKEDQKLMLEAERLAIEKMRALNEKLNTKYSTNVFNKGYNMFGDLFQFPSLQFSPISWRS